MKIKLDKMTISAIILLVGTGIYSFSQAIAAMGNATFQFIEMIKIVPPIFLMIGLLDVWVPKETMIKMMGEKSGVFGILIAFLFGSFSAGPLIAAFPVAMIMLKKEAKYSNVLFFLTIWASAKLPIIFFQVTTLGSKYTVISNITLVFVYMIGSIIMEKSLGKKELTNIYHKASIY